jgi:hypothetical protein
MIEKKSRYKYSYALIHAFASHEINKYRKV